MPPPTLPYGARLRGRTQPLAPEDDLYAWAHWILCESIGRIFLEVQEVFDPEGDIPPVAPILSVDLCPAWALPWLAQFLGVTIPAGTDPGTARELIRNVSGFQRGTAGAMRAAAGLFLTGNQTVYFRERDGGAYQLEVVTLDSETPDPDMVLRALMAQKPGGIILRYRSKTGWDYQALTALGLYYRDIAVQYSSYRALTLNEAMA